MLPLTARQFWSCLCATAVLSGAVDALTSPIKATGPDCQTEDGAVQVTEDCVDATYKTVIIDADTNLASPVPHRRISGRFYGTEIDFNIYLPETGWDGRFFQLVYPTQNSTAEAREIGFGAASGGYTLKVAGGGGYRADAALAKLSRSIARDHYNKPDQKIYGYVYGASGGSMVTVGAIENTHDVWQGAIPIVQAITISIPTNYCLRGFAGTVLEAQKEKLINAVRPGSGLNPFNVVDPMRREVLKEVTELGLPLSVFEDWDGVAGYYRDFPTSFRTLVLPLIAQFDPTYVNDFWTKEGYVGTEKSKLGDFYRDTLLYEYNATVQSVTSDANDVPTFITLNSVPSEPPEFGLQFTVEAEDGTSKSFTAQLDMKTKVAIIDPDQDAAITKLLATGTKVHIDNRAWLAATTYHRHQVPSRDGFYAWDYIRKADGTPKYPQRAIEIGDFISNSASGGATWTGKTTLKVIAMDTMMDFDSVPWHADWYRSQVEKQLGARYGDSYRLHYTDHADHYIQEMPKENTARLVQYNAMLDQHLRDLSAWVEKGTKPPTGTSFSVSHGQVKLPATAAQRKGIQPVVDLTSGNKTSVSVRAGRPVVFKAHAEVPSSTGTITAVEWDFEGTGDFVKQNIGQGKGIMDLTVTRKYPKRGTYFVAVRVASNRKGDNKTPYAQVQNLGRMRVNVY
ncbi:hypothetical protein FSARC_9751 [Fusarium sarcochroum]|uniref:PKD domain-containing protein n=1 Tax=Fusarium sarcochroum TaxID=1208366 RepID=A0A8H4X504_9HYPO|nr:hypothetical protein FSARC_9751 [Fusarium sarcochroum]